MLGVDAEGSVWALGSDSPDGRRTTAEVGAWREVQGAEDVVGLVREVKELIDGREMEKAGEPFFVFVDALDWKVIPVENFIAAFASMSSVKLVMACETVEEARLMSEVMEVGTDGVWVRPTSIPTSVPTSVPTHVWAAFVRDEYFGGGMANAGLEVGVVTRVEPCGMGDRICVDLAENMEPGEGFLLGSFARGLFLVHSECEETSYINSRPFRVNAGPVHSYLELFDDRTGYLSELVSGRQVAVFDWRGGVRKSTVGRIKMEKRPLVNVTAVGKESGVSYSVMLQLAETVKLVGPSGEGYRTVSVSVLEEGDEVFLLEHGEAARHTGIAIKESIREY